MGQRTYSILNVKLRKRGRNITQLLNIYLQILKIWWYCSTPVSRSRGFFQKMNSRLRIQKASFFSSLNFIRK